VCNEDSEQFEIEESIELKKINSTSKRRSFEEVSARV
jgi:hypothetical protein